MKQNAFLLSFLLLTACTGSEQKQKQRTDDALKVATEISTNEPVAQCYYRTAGDKNEDTAMLRLIAKAHTVTGDLYYLPHEKDARIGTILGERVGDKVTALWSYSQEGMNDTLSVAFKIKGRSIFQKPNVFNPKRGREVLPDNVDYELEYTEMDCAKFRRR